MKICKSWCFCNSVRSCLSIERDAPGKIFVFQRPAVDATQAARRDDERRDAEKQKRLVSATASIDRQLLTELRERLNAGGARIVGFAQGHGIQRTHVLRPGNSVEIAAFACDISLSL